MPIDLVRADAAAVTATVDLVAQVTDQSLPTPCAGWDLGALVTHMTEQHGIFAAAAQGGPVADELSYPAAAALVLRAFAEPGVLDRPFRLPEFPSAFPGRVAIGFHLVDYVVHGWDVAVSLGVPYAVDPDILALTLPIAWAVPSGGSPAFAPALAVPPGTAPLDEILLRLGRDPAIKLPA
ncbi:TIGR03086 family metal-binding protein [Paractinoplanes durhamensis]|uniref:TIGR03086 family protein n=1 Tax=Paractinoplanes durhamensis TaxID=113563 RepID=A0ABQ3YXG3_9ACTN|nr:TIGR03086 family metal-binding protein [Actinoplanes durhamensis]GIE02241.1 TIGR03086 family protein [Actinoplanes durhamensis]